MEKLLTLMKELKLKKDDVNSIKEYGDKLTHTVNDIFKTCKLDPETDEPFLLLWVQFLKEQKILKMVNTKVGTKKFTRLFLDYEKLFKHEGWKH